jgi:hypothetical protein
MTSQLERRTSRLMEPPAQEQQPSSSRWVSSMYAGIGQCGCMAKANPIARRTCCYKEQAEQEATEGADICLHLHTHHIVLLAHYVSTVLNWSCTSTHACNIRTDFNTNTHVRCRRSMTNSRSCLGVQPPASSTPHPPHLCFE